MSSSPTRTRLVWLTLLTLLVLPWVWLVGRLQRSASQPWVIGGHRGRMVEDNAGALHAWMQANTTQALVWIADPPVVEAMRAAGHPTLVRDSLAARIALFRAPVLITSHGDDDLDTLAHLFRGLTGTRVYLNHSLNVYKAGNAHTPEYQGAGPIRRWWLRRVMTDFDLLPACSPHEAACFQLAFPHRADRILPTGGGAHLDGFFSLAHTTPSNTIYYFPTHRDDDDGRRGLATTLRALTENEELRAWLLRENLTFRIGAHINSGAHPLQVAAPFELRSLATLKSDMAEAQLFISDYSGLLANFLVFDRPTISFVFDREHYLRGRLLYASIEEFATGPVCNTLPELITTLTSGKWRDSDTWRERRRRWQERIFVSTTADYSERCWQTIVRHVGAAPEGT